ncbi:sodium/iodide cotransporter-like [Amblyomma americanum]
MAKVVDYAVFSLLTGASLGVGCYFSIRRKKAAPGQTTDELFLGSKSLQTLPLAASVLATVGSATGVVGLPAHTYAYGLHLGWLCLSNVLLIPFAAAVVVPVLYRLNITSVFQFVRMRYNTAVSVITAITYILLSQMVGAIAIYASSVAVSTVFNISAIWCSVVIGLTATTYTAMAH